MATEWIGLHGAPGYVHTTLVCSVWETEADCGAQEHERKGHLGGGW